MRKMVFLLIGFISLSCSSQNLKLLDSHDLTKNHEVFNNFVDRYEAFRDIENRANYKIYEQDGFFYLEGTGTNKAKNNVVFRIRFTSFQDNTLLNALDGESCSGVKCEHCAFKKGGGCECKSGTGSFGTGSCDHTVTR